MGRGLIILLVASLGLNIFAGGYLSGRILAGDKPRPPVSFDARGGGFDDPFRIMRYAEELSPDMRDSFREAFREQLPALREEHRAMRGLRRELAGLMSADVWDSAAIGAKLDEIRDAQNRQHDAFSRAFMSAFETLPAEERKRLIETANERRREMGKRFKRDGGDGPVGPPPGEGEGFGPPPPPED